MTPNPTTPQDTAKLNRLGLLLMTCGFFCFSLADLFSKVLTEGFHPFQITWVRLFGLMSAVIVLLLVKGPGILRSGAPGLQVFRGVIAIISSLAFVLALRTVPLAEAVAVSFVAPFFVTVMAALFLREKVGWRRWLAISIGFIGVLVIIRPGLGVLSPAIGFVLLAALCFAGRQVVSRSLAKRDSTVTTIAYTAIVATTLLFIPMVLVWKTPETGREIMYFVLMAGVAALGELFIIRALEIANAVVVAPVHYSLILFSTLWGFLVFADLPDVWTWVGAGIVVLSGLYTLYRESQTKRPVIPVTPIS
ncbi:MAG: DMT family transporter [Maritimibacter sp.]